MPKRVADENYRYTADENYRYTIEKMIFEFGKLTYVPIKNNYQNIKFPWNVM